MPLPAVLEGRLRIPAVAAPMFLVSGPDLVVETCRSGVLGTFPALNQRTTAGFDAWLDEIEGRLGADDAPYGVNLIVHRTNARVEADLAVCVKHRVPVVITSLGAVKEVVDAVHGYGGVVFHDVINTRHAKSAARAGVDGLILVCAGAGGHAGTMSPFALVPEVRSFFPGTLLLSGALSDGRAIAAARVLGADLAYIGTRFIATDESMAPAAYKSMILDSNAADIVYTDRVSGVHASFLRQSLVANGLDPDNLPPHHGMNVAAEIDPDEAKAWKDLWSAGQGVGSIRDLPKAGDLCARLAEEYRAAIRAMTAA